MVRVRWPRLLDFSSCRETRRLFIVVLAGMVFGDLGMTMTGCRMIYAGAAWQADPTWAVFAHSPMAWLISRPLQVGGSILLALMCWQYGRSAGWPRRRMWMAAAWGLLQTLGVLGAVCAWWPVVLGAAPVAGVLGAALLRTICAPAPSPG